MNEQNNNFNSQFNNQLANSNNNGVHPTQPVKNRFFSPDLFEDANVNAVGSSTSNSVSNNVISWGVGQKSENHGDLSKANVQSNIVQSNMMEQVNGVIYTDEQPEILDDSFLMGDTKNSNDNQFGMKNTPFSELQNNSTSMNINGQNQNMQQFSQSFGGGQQQSYQNSQTTIQPVQQPIPQQVQPIIQPVQQPVPQQLQVVQQPVAQTQAQQQVQTGYNQMTPTDQSWKEGIGVVQPVGDDWMNQQPLSASSLGVSPSASNAPKDVVNESKFFNNNINNNSQNKQEMQQQYTMQYANGVAASLAEAKVVVDEMPLLKQYVGDKFTKITMAPFSFAALLLGGFYFMYRKMYLLGIILTFSEFALINTLPTGISTISLIVYRLVLSLAVNPLYIKIAKGKVKGIVNKKANQKKNQIELNTICKRKGGTSFGKAFLLMFFCLIVEVIVSFTIFSASIISKVYDFISNGIISVDNGKYDGVIKTSDYDVLSNMNIEIPTDFKKSESSEFYYIYTDSNTSGDFNTCTLSIGKLSGYDSVEEFINQYIEYEELEENIGKTNSKGITWYTLTHESKGGTRYLRTAELNGDIILFNYKVGADTTSGVCDVYLVNILDSISLKEK